MVRTAMNPRTLDHAMNVGTGRYRSAIFVAGNVAPHRRGVSRSRVPASILRRTAGRYRTTGPEPVIRERRMLRFANASGGTDGAEAGEVIPHGRHTRGRAAGGGHDEPLRGREAV